MLWQESALAILGSIALLEGDIQTALDYLKKSVAQKLPSKTVQVYTGRLAWMGFVLQILGRREEAWHYMQIELDRALDDRCYLAILTSLAGAALLLADDGEAEQAVALHALLSEHPYTANAHWFSQIITPVVMMAAAGFERRTTVSRGRERSGARCVGDGREAG